MLEQRNGSGETLYSQDRMDGSTLSVEQSGGIGRQDLPLVLG